MLAAKNSAVGKKITMPIVKRKYFTGLTCNSKNYAFTNAQAVSNRVFNYLEKMPTLQRFSQLAGDTPSPQGEVGRKRGARSVIPGRAQHEPGNQGAPIKTAQHCLETPWIPDQRGDTSCRDLSGMT